MAKGSPRSGGWLLSLVALASGCHAASSSDAARPSQSAREVRAEATGRPKVKTPGITGVESAKPSTSTGLGFNDVHVHLTNYVQEGPDIRTFLDVMGERVERAALFGIPLQQTWSVRVDGTRAPGYYLNSDSPLYYYSFTDAYIAMTYLSLTEEERARFDPMITGFNPADMYAADHIRRVLETFPGVFSGIGEFTIHKEFVSGKVAGVTPSLTDPALDRIFEFAGEVGLLVLIHNDMDVPFSKPGEPPAYLDSMVELLRRHPRTQTIWAHTGLGRVVQPMGQHAATIGKILEDPTLSHVSFDVSWDEVGKYLMHDAHTVRISADLFNRFPDRFLFGTDEVSPSDPEKYFRLIETFGPLWQRVTPEASKKIRSKNYERLFDQARAKVRAWEKANL